MVRAARAVIDACAAERKMPRQDSNATAAAIPIAVAPIRPLRRRSSPSVQVAIMKPASHGQRQPTVWHRPSVVESRGDDGVVGGEHEGRTDRRGGAQEHGDDPVGVAMVELAGRLVGEYQGRTGDEDPCDRDALGLTAGQFVGQFRRRTAHADEIECRPGVLVRSRPRPVPPRAWEVRRSRRRRTRVGDSGPERRCRSRRDDRAAERAVRATERFPPSGYQPRRAGATGSTFQIRTDPVTAIRAVDVT